MKKNSSSGSKNPIKKNEPSSKSKPKKIKKVSIDTLKKIKGGRGGIWNDNNPMRHA